MTLDGLSRRVVSAALALALLATAACSRKKTKESPGNQARSNDNGSPSGSHHRARPRPAITVAAVPPGAPTSGDLLAFPEGARVFFDWRKTPVWADVTRRLFRFPRSTASDVTRILKKGWKNPGAPRLLTFLTANKSVLDGATKLPACAPLRKTWARTELLLEHRSLFTLRMLQEALLLRARYHQHHGRSGPALDAAIAALRFACHMAHVPELLMRLMAIRAEELALSVLMELSGDRSGCPRVRRAMESHRAQRAPLAQMAQADWLMARSHLRMITKDLTKSRSADAKARRRLRSLMRLLLGRTSAQYGRYSLLARQGLATGRDGDWTALDEHREKLSAGLAVLKKKYGVKSSMALTDVVAKLPGKPAAWTADVMSQIFLSLVTVRSAFWKRARLMHRTNLATLEKLRAKRCSSLPRSSARP